MIQQQQLTMGTAPGPVGGRPQAQADRVGQGIGDRGEGAAALIGFSTGTPSRSYRQPRRVSAANGFGYHSRLFSES
jgi:hypothetical protein